MTTGKLTSLCIMLGDYVGLMDKAIKRFYWLWLLVLVVFNAIPLGNEANRSLSGNKLWRWRLDYLLHLAMILVFAFIWVMGKNRNVNWFASYETLKYIMVVVAAGIGLELIQLALPWRAFNPMDMLSNLIGAGLATLIILILSFHNSKKIHGS